MLRRLYDWTLDLAGHRHALWALFFVAVIESSFFIVPPDVLLIPMVSVLNDVKLLNQFLMKPKRKEERQGYS